MPWTDLFKSKKAQAVQADPQVRWFGKLPTYADYYSSKADQDWAVEFNDWILRGYEVYLGHFQAAQQPGTPVDKAARRLPLGCLVLRLPRSGMTVLAAVQDYGGDMQGRPFPLFFYVAVPTAQLPGPASVCVPRVARALRDLANLRDRVIRFLNSPGRFETVFDGREIDLAGFDGEFCDESWLEAARKISTAEWFAEVHTALPGLDLKGWYQRLLDWGHSIAGNESETFEPTFRFPLAMTLPVDAQMATWIRWLEPRMDLKRRLLSLTVSGEAGKGVGWLCVIARETVVEDFQLLTSLGGSLAYVDDATRLKAPAPAAAAQTAEAAALPAAESAASVADPASPPAQDGTPTTEETAPAEDAANGAVPNVYGEPLPLVSLADLAVPPRGALAV